MSGYLLDWGSLLVRWIHVITGIAWIGSSFYFVWLDNHLLAPEQPDAEPGVAGELWAVHGGGFYRARKYQAAPAILPRTLHWFYWEAYSTWLSGMGLLGLLYFLQADAYLIDPAVRMLSPAVAVTIAVGILIGSWLVYDALCRSQLGRSNVKLGIAVALLMCALAWGVCALFSGRGAFILFGAAIGTIMVANVFFVIIPGQRELVRARQAGRAVDPAPGLRGKQRSVHNTYFTLPVLFVMISNHYAMTYGAHYNWLVLVAMSFSGVCIRAWFVARHKPEGRQGFGSLLLLIMGLLALLSVIIGLYPDDPAAALAGSAPLTAAQAEAILDRRCVPCHSHSPTQPGFSAPPNGLVLNSPGQLRAHLPDVKKQLTLRTMPLGNITGMTDVERARPAVDWPGRYLGETRMLTVQALNAMSVPEFTAALGSIFEHSPWVAQRAARLRPFASREQLHQAMCQQVAQASVAEQDALLVAHPKLGARGRQRAQLTQASAHEQSRAGLDACTDEEFTELLRLNELYMARFAFPFILAVRGHTPESILAAITQRLRNDPATERATALQQVNRIAGFRLGDSIAPPAESATQAGQ